VDVTFRELGPFGIVAGLMWMWIQGLKDQLTKSQALQADMTAKVITTLQENTKSQAASAAALESVAVAIRELGHDIHGFVLGKIDVKS
jgi:hypothetical protein